MDDIGNHILAENGSRILAENGIDCIMQQTSPNYPGGEEIRINNFEFVKAPDGISVSEKTR